MNFIPAVVQRAKRPITPPPAPVDAKTEKSRLKKFSEGSQASLAISDAKIQQASQQTNSENEEANTGWKIVSFNSFQYLKINFCIFHLRAIAEDICFS